MSKTIIITGASGQIGSYLVEDFLKHGYTVVAIVRRVIQNILGNISHIKNKNLIIECGNVVDGVFIDNIVKKYKPELYINCAAQSFVKVSFDNPVEVWLINYGGVTNALGAIKEYSSKTKFIQMSTSEMFGANKNIPFNENSRMRPVSPYARAKHEAYLLVKKYRKKGLFACNAICFNTESCRRGEEFVTRKITQGAVRIKLGKQKELILGNLEAKRDWSHVLDIIDGLKKILNHSEPDDFVLASGKTHSVEDFIKLAFEYVGIKNWKKYVKTDKKFLRPTEVDILCGDYSKAEKVLGWKPTIKFEDLIKEMIVHDLENERNKKTS